MASFGTSAVSAFRSDSTNRTAAPASSSTPIVGTNQPTSLYMPSSGTGGQSAEAGLASTSVVGAFDPGHDLDSEVVTGLPAMPSVEDVLLEQSEERLHGGEQTDSLPRFALLSHLTQGFAGLAVTTRLAQPIAET